MNKQRLNDVIKHGVGKNVMRGNPMVTPKDIKTCKNYLDVIVRTIFIENKISKEEFKEVVIAYADTLGIHPSKTANMVGSMKKSICDGNISYKRFVQTLKMLGMDITDITVTTISKHGVQEFSSHKKETKTK